MYKQDDATIKRTVIAGTETEPQETEVTIKVRGDLTPDQIKSITEIADRAAEQAIDILQAAGD